uniref:MADF domain-containing protein n=1 Tax=Acrobeloides nanus TaxID=290746 RepID=A0A914E6Q7_9BILA
MVENIKKSERLALDEIGDAAISAFIDLLQKYPIVWDKTLPDYKNNIKKGLAFKAMDEEMRVAGHTSAAGLISTSQLYGLIKRRYKREWGRAYYHSSGSSGSSNVNKWAFLDALSFLHNHVEDSSRRVQTGFNPQAQSDLSEPSRTNEAYVQDNTNALSEFEDYDVLYSPMASSVVSTSLSIPVASTSQVSSVATTDIFSPGWRKRKLREEEKRSQAAELRSQIEVLKSMKETCAVPQLINLPSINQKYVELWASRLDALPRQSQARIRLMVEHALFEENIHTH